MSGTTVETTIHVLSRWLEKGLVREEDDRLVVPSLEVLRELQESKAE
jgi:hypothetical protein